MKVLVTAGATREHLDGVRFLTNVSTGATGAALATTFSLAGHEVVLLCGEGAEKPKAPTVEVARFRGFADLDERIRATLAEGRFDLVVHSAAVSDYSVAWVKPSGSDGAAPVDGGKLASTSSGLTLELTRNFKIVDRLKEYAGKSAPRVVAFKLTNTSSPEERAQAVARLAASPGVDFIVHNDLGEMRAGRHPFRLIRAGAQLAECDGRDALGRLLLDQVFERLT